MAQKTVIKYDSIVIHDSIYMAEIHDTIFKERWHNEIRFVYKDRWRDSVRIVQDTIIQVETVKQNNTSKGRTRSKVIDVMLCAIFVVAAFGMASFLQKFK